MNDINFGALLLNSKKMRTFTIENRGDKFDLKFAITKPVREEKPAAADGKAKRGLGFFSFLNCDFKNDIWLSCNRCAVLTLQELGQCTKYV